MRVQTIILIFLWRPYIHTCIFLSTSSSKWSTFNFWTYLICIKFQIVLWTIVTMSFKKHYALRFFFSKSVKFLGSNQRISLKDQFIFNLAINIPLVDNLSNLFFICKRLSCHVLNVYTNLTMVRACFFSCTQFSFDYNNDYVEQNIQILHRSYFDCLTVCCS